METRKIDYLAILTECQQAYRKAAVYDTFLALKLGTILHSVPDLEEVAKKTDLNLNALSRFLHAAASLGLVLKINGRFVPVENCAVYTKESSIALFWLFNSKLPDFLKNKAKSLNEIIKAYPNLDTVMFSFVISYHLIIKNENDTYSVPDETKKYLLSDSPDYIGHRIKHFEKIMFPMFSVKGLLGALKTGKSQWGAFFGNEVTHPFDLYKNDPALLETFTNGMHQLNLDDNKTVLDTIKLKDIKTVLDVGGGSGAFVLKLLEQNNSIEKVDIYELPDAIPLMEKVFQKYAPNEARVRFVGGSFMQETKENNLSGLNPEHQYDLIVLGWILHDWSDETNINILRRILNHLKETKTLLILESILPENRVGAASLADLTMLLQTEGRERMFSEYKNLLFLSGFNDVSTMPCESRRQPIMASRPAITSHL